MPKKKIPGMEVTGVNKLEDALALL
jgi:hypothetical protein